MRCFQCAKEVLPVNRLCPYCEWDMIPVEKPKPVEPAKIKDVDKNKDFVGKVK